MTGTKCLAHGHQDTHRLACGNAPLAPMCRWLRAPSTWLPLVFTGGHTPTTPSPPRMPSLGMPSCRGTLCSLPPGTPFPPVVPGKSQSSLQDPRREAPAVCHSVPLSQHTFDPSQPNAIKSFHSSRHFTHGCVGFGGPSPGLPTGQQRVDLMPCPGPWPDCCCPPRSERPR